MTALNFVLAIFMITGAKQASFIRQKKVFGSVMSKVVKQEIYAETNN